ncbi:MAG: DUF3597 domain-containing protein [Beijerinckiaceae bacterium]
MSIFGTIMSKILGKAPESSASAAQVRPSGQASGTTNTAPSSSAVPEVDVAAVLDALSAKTTEKLDWRRSIVDLMKLLSIDSSLAARKALASELHYDGDTSNSASMNIWLHKQIMAKLAANGGKLPDDLKN